MRPSLAALLRNALGGGHAPLRRAGLLLRNAVARFRSVPPHACCGHPGEPGC